MAVKIGSARSDENGRITGGKAGDQTGKEVSTQDWYLHRKGWRVFRAKDSARGEKIAQCMERACANAKIGYDQNERNDLYNAAKKYGFDVSKVTANVETDCSALVRVCCAYAGISLSDFNTESEPTRLRGCGYFQELAGSKYQSQSVYLRRGDILVTKTKGHTVIVLSNGSKCEDMYSLPNDKLLKYGSAGMAVQTLQTRLISLGYDLGRYGADGDFGDCTELAVKAFQSDAGITVDGIAGEETLAAIERALEEDEAARKAAQKDPACVTVRIVNGNCYIRPAPNTANTPLGVALRGEEYSYQGQTDNGWNLIVFQSRNAWVSGKYSEVVE